MPISAVKDHVVFDTLRRTFSAARALSVIAYELRELRRLYTAHLVALQIPLPLTRSEQQEVDSVRPAPVTSLPEEVLAEQRASEIIAARLRGEDVEGPGSDWEPL